jgi:hypothetical protein
MDGRAGSIWSREYRNERVAIEIDYRSPREKSLDKLRQFKAIGLFACAAST